MRSRSTPPSQTAPEKQRRAARATPNMAAGAPTTGRRSRRAQPVASGLAELAPSLPPAALAVLAPEELYRREKARRERKLDDDVMVEAKRMLDEMLAESSRRGGTVKGGRRPARPAKPASRDPLDAMDLDQFTGLDADEKKDGSDDE
jgi:hypothetical protein